MPCAFGVARRAAPREMSLGYLGSEPGVRGVARTVRPRVLTVRDMGVSEN